MIDLTKITAIPCDLTNCFGRIGGKVKFIVMTESVL